VFYTLFILYTILPAVNTWGELQREQFKDIAMNKTQILDFINTNPVCHLATADGDQPRVRGMMMYKADDNGIIFHTGDFKDLYQQLKKNPKVEICFNSSDQRNQVRVCGIAEFIDKMDLKKEIVSARPFMKPQIDRQGYNMLIVFRVKNLKAATWSMATNFEPTTYIDI
jgi:pyridoxamine 5'-phosphate oxidase